jgi:hypothetical protein
MQIRAKRLNKMSRRGILIIDGVSSVPEPSRDGAMHFSEEFWERLESKAFHVVPYNKVGHPASFAGDNRN